MKRTDDLQLRASHEADVQDKLITHVVLCGSPVTHFSQTIINRGSTMLWARLKSGRIVELLCHQLIKGYSLTASVMSELLSHKLFEFCPSTPRTTLTEALQDNLLDRVYRSNRNATDVAVRQTSTGLLVAIAPLEDGNIVIVEHEPNYRVPADELAMVELELKAMLAASGCLDAVETLH